MITKENKVFRALSDPTRRRILILLIDRPMTIGQVVDEFDVSRGAIKKHLIILEEGALISVKAQGRERINSLNVEGLKPVMHWLSEFDRFWDERLNKLKNVIESDVRRK